MNEQRIDDLLAALQARDPQLGEELRDRLAGPDTDARLDSVEAAERSEPRRPKKTTEAAPGLLSPKTIVLKTGRPVLAIRDDLAVLTIEEAESQVWRARLKDAQPRLTGAIRAIGRVELEGHPDYAWVGTGWLVAEDMIVTNRHVAQVFARRAGQGFSFRPGLDGRDVSAHLDFLREAGSEKQRVRPVTQVLHIEDDNGPDLAFLKLASASGHAPIALVETAAQVGRQVAVVGYPARDSRIPDLDLMERLFGNVYDVKRLAPGQVSGIDPRGGELLHDCTTLGGNSGSAILALDDGRAVGLHFAGRFLQANFAVPAASIAERLHAQLRGGARPSPAPGTASGVVVHDTATAPTPEPTTDTGDDDLLADTEAPIGSYANRQGYDSAFLGAGLEVPLPELVRDKDQLLSFDFGGNPAETELRYHHFSVFMHRARRMCFFSAVNIDGGQSRKTRRPGWQYDPRIPREFQIMKECYGNPPRFSRGHMTRREDPAWGDVSGAQLGNADSMHVTNAVPQMQTFNGGIWLGLEDYALQNAREDDMRISVFTGPIFDATDEMRYGVVIPVRFWKVIAFVHDRTGQLSATGYSMSQASFLGEEEFVFGRYETHQRSLGWIESHAGASFGPLRAHDRFREEEGLDRPLTSPHQIRW